MLKVDTHQYPCSGNVSYASQVALDVRVVDWTLVDVISLHVGVGNLGCVEGGHPPVSM